MSPLEGQLWANRDTGEVLQITYVDFKGSLIWATSRLDGADWIFAMPLFIELHIPHVGVTR